MTAREPIQRREVRRIEYAAEATGPWVLLQNVLDRALSEYRQERGLPVNAPVAADEVRYRVAGDQVVVAFDVADTDEPEPEGVVLPASKPSGPVLRPAVEGGNDAS